MPTAVAKEKAISKEEYTTWEAEILATMRPSSFKRKSVKRVGSQHRNTAGRRTSPTKKRSSGGLVPPVGKLMTKHKVILVFDLMVDGVPMSGQTALQKLKLWHTGTVESKFLLHSVGTTIDSLSHPFGVYDNESMR